MSGNFNLIFLVVIMIVMFFMMNRSQKKQRSNRESMMSKLQPGAHVVTIGRLHGVVDSVNQTEKTFTLDADGVYLVFDLDAIARVIDDGVDQAVKPTEEATTTTETNVIDKTKTVLPKDENTEK